MPDLFFHVHLYIEQFSEFIHPFIDLGHRPQVKMRVINNSYFIFQELVFHKFEFNFYIFSLEYYKKREIFVGEFESTCLEHKMYTCP